MSSQPEPSVPSESADATPDVTPDVTPNGEAQDGQGAPGVYFYGEAAIPHSHRNYRLIEMEFKLDGVYAVKKDSDEPVKIF